MKTKTYLVRSAKERSKGIRKISTQFVSKNLFSPYKILILYRISNSYLKFSFDNNFSENFGFVGFLFL